jgi:hypothetical protein
MPWIRIERSPFFERSQGPRVLRLKIPGLLDAQARELPDNKKRSFSFLPSASEESARLPSLHDQQMTSL